MKLGDHPFDILQASTATTGSRRRLVALGAGVALVLVGLRIAQADPAITANVDAQPPAKRLSADESRAVSFSAQRILKHVDRAIDALVDKKDGAALNDINQGLLLVQIISNALPATKVKTEIRAGNVSYSDRDLVKPAMVSIYREFDQVEDIALVSARASKSGAKFKSPIPEAVADDGEYSAVKLNVKLARQDLLEAESLVKQKDTKTAIAVLRDIPASGLVFEFSVVDRPLRRVADNLRLAEVEFKDHRTDEARATLGGASDELKHYSAASGDRRAKEVQQLKNEIDQASKAIDHETAETFSKKIGEWWAKTFGWFGK